MKAPQLQLHQPPPAVAPVLSGGVEDCLVREPPFSRKEIEVVGNSLGVAPLPDASGKRRFRLKFPKKRVIILVVKKNWEGCLQRYSTVNVSLSDNIQI